MRHKDLISEKDQEESGLYFVHHMHHYEAKEEAVHEVHHCPLFSKKDMKGEQYSLNHLLLDGKLYHVLDRKPVGVLYDHTNRGYKIKEIRINNKKYYVFS